MLLLRQYICYALLFYTGNSIDIYNIIKFLSDNVVWQVAICVWSSYFRFHSKSNNIPTW